MTTAQSRWEKSSQTNFFTKAIYLIKAVFMSAQQEINVSSSDTRVKVFQCILTHPRLLFFSLCACYTHTHTGCRQQVSWCADYKNVSFYWFFQRNSRETSVCLYSGQDVMYSRLRSTSTLLGHSRYFRLNHMFYTLHSIFLTCSAQSQWISHVYRRKMQHLEETHAGTRRTHNIHTERLQTRFEPGTFSLWQAPHRWGGAWWKQWMRLIKIR